ncbi:MAG: ABC transporter ATP-binding protein [Lachnospiraceae bacterium]|jgi:putative ABC transport system ATP-binding protein|nr:ABC transporter ATP-binding protein [Lachnospiraceae bacterium]
MFVEVKNLKKDYGTGENIIHVLKGLSFQLEKGEICTVLGPSGAGKSTLLNLIGGIDTLTSGEIRIAGKLIELDDKDGLLEYRRDHLGFVFQFYNLIPDLTVKENIEVCGFLGKNNLDINKLLSDLGLKEHQNKFPRQLSGGQQQRTSIGRALIKAPTLLLCDEPTGALDYETSKEILELLERVNHEYNTTILIVTHNEAISHMSDRIIHLKDGRITNNLVNPRKTAARDLTW